MDNKTTASAIPANNMIIAILIFAQIPIMFGQLPTTAFLCALPWLLAAYPVILICVVMMFKNGEFVDATMNAILSGVLMGQNFVRGIMLLTMLNAGSQLPADLQSASFLIDKWVYLAGGIILIFAGWLAHFKSKMAATGVWCGAIGFLALACLNAGFGDVFGLIGGIGLVILGIYLLYSGIAMLVNMTIGKDLFPLK